MINAIMEIDATQVLDLNLTEDDDDIQEKKQIGKLVTRDHKEMKSTEYMIYEGANEIGRGEECAIAMTPVKSLSKKHACIEASVDGSLVFDCGSRNKTRKGKMILKPYVRYDIKDGDEVTFGNLVCQFCITDVRGDASGDETGSLTASEAEEDVEDVAKEKEENENKIESEAVTNIQQDDDEDDEEDSPSIFQVAAVERERLVEDSFNSSDIVLPTQKYTKTEDDRESIDSMDEEMKNVNTKVEDDRAAYVVETDEETDDGGENDEKNNSLAAIGETPGIGLKKLKQLTLPESDLDNTIGTPKDKSTQPRDSIDMTGKFFLDSPPVEEPPADKLSCSFSGELDAFADTLPMAQPNVGTSRDDGPNVGTSNDDACDDEMKKEVSEHGNTITKLLAEQFADTIPINKDKEKDDDIDKEEDEYEDIVGTYQFDTADFVGNRGDDDDDDVTTDDGDDINDDNDDVDGNDQKETGSNLKEAAVPTPTSNLIPAVNTPSLEMVSRDDGTSQESQEVPYRKCKTSTLILDGYQSFGTPFSSINASVGSSSAGRNSVPKMVVSDSDDEPATQAYNIPSPQKSPQMRNATPSDTTDQSKKNPQGDVKASLPGASLVSVYEAVDIGTQMSSDDEKRKLEEKSKDAEDGTKDNDTSDQDNQNKQTQDYENASTQAYADIYGNAATQMYETPDQNTQAYNTAATQAYADLDTQAYNTAATQVYAELDTQAYNTGATQAYADQNTQAYGAASTQAFCEMETQPYISTTGMDDGATQTYVGQVGSDDETASENEEDEDKPESHKEEKNDTEDVPEKETEEISDQAGGKEKEVDDRNEQTEDRPQDDKVVEAVATPSEVTERPEEDEIETQVYDLMEVDEEKATPTNDAIDGSAGQTRAVNEEETDERNDEKATGNALTEATSGIGRSLEDEDDTKFQEKTASKRGTSARRGSSGRRGTSTRRGRGRQSKAAKQMEEAPTTSKDRQKKDQATEKEEDDENSADVPREMDRHKAADTEKEDAAINESAKEVKETDVLNKKPKRSTKKELTDNSENTKVPKKRGRKKGDDDELVIDDKNENETEKTDNGKQRKTQDNKATENKEKNTKTSRSRRGKRASQETDNDTKNENIDKTTQNYDSNVDFEEPKTTKGKRTRKNDVDITDVTDIQQASSSRQRGQLADVEVDENNDSKETKANENKGRKSTKANKKSDNIEPVDDSETVPTGRRGKRGKSSVAPKQNESIENEELLQNKLVENEKPTESSRSKRGKGRLKQQKIEESFSAVEQSGSTEKDNEKNKVKPTSSRRKTKRKATDNNEKVEEHEDEVSQSSSKSNEKTAPPLVYEKEPPKRKGRKSKKIETVEQSDVVTTPASPQQSTKNKRGKHRKTKETEEEAESESQTSTVSITSSRLSSISQTTDDTTIGKNTNKGKGKARKKTEHIKQDEADTSGAAGSSRRSSFGGRPRVVFTGISDKEVEKIVTDLGGSIIEHVDRATHLVTDKVRRTVKFMCAVARGVPIVTPDWLKRSKSAGLFTDPDKFLLKDSAAEKQYKFKLQNSLAKARDSPLLQDQQIYVTKSVKPEPKCMKEMIECCGGKFLTNANRLPVDALVISCDEDIKEIEKYKEDHHICTNELLLTGILRQEIDKTQFALDITVETNEEEKPTNKRKRNKTSDAAPKSKRKR